MKKNRKILSLLLVMTLILSFTACRTKTTQTLTKTETTKTDNNTETAIESIITESTIKPEKTTEPEPEPEPVVHTVELIAVGDNLIHSNVIKSGKQSDGSYNYDNIYANIKNEIESADVKIINQETVLVSDPNKYSGYPTFGSPYAIGDATVAAGFNVITHATNHSYDKGSTGVLDTVSYWKTQENVTMTGMYDSQEDYNNISIREVNGIKIAFLNYTYGLNGLTVPEDKKYYINTLYSEEKVVEDLKKANELADFVIVLPHWGTEYVYEPTEYQISWSRVFVENGADLIIGTHPHVVEPLDIIIGPNGEQVPCYYSLGNFVSCQDEVPRMLGGMAKVTIEMTEGEPAHIVSSTMEPTVTHIEAGCKSFTTYMLKDYTDELAANHWLTTKGKKISVEGLTELYDSIVNGY